MKLYHKQEEWGNANALLITGNENLRPLSIKPHIPAMQEFSLGEAGKIWQSKTLRLSTWLGDCMYCCDCVRGGGDGSRRPQYGSLIREQEERKYSCEKKELHLARQRFLEKVLCQLIHMHRCDNYFPLPELTCSAYLCGRLFLLLPREEYFCCLPCACWAFSHETRL